MAIDIRRITAQDADGFHAALAEVAGERKFLATIDPPPIDSTRQWIRKNVDSGVPQFVAVDTGSGEIVGWCDVSPRDAEGFRHVGRLGMGVRKAWRGQGIGTRLLAATLAAAKAMGLEKVRLGVFASNAAAIALYRRKGFVEEGRFLRARKLDGQYDDLVMMGLFFQETK